MKAIKNLVLISALLTGTILFADSEALTFVGNCVTALGPLGSQPVSQVGNFRVTPKENEDARQIMEFEIPGNPGTEKVNAKAIFDRRDNSIYLQYNFRETDFDGDVQNRQTYALAGNVTRGTKLIFQTELVGYVNPDHVEIKSYGYKLYCVGHVE